MAHLNYDNNIITQAPAGAASCAEPRQHDRGMPVTRCWSALAGRVQRRAFLGKVSKFLLVGGIGALVNSLALFLLFQRAHLPLVLASVLSAEVAIIHNFCWNDRWTFGRTRPSLRRFAKFNLVSLAGLVITTCTLWLLAGHLGVYYLAANLLGIALATAWNFAVNVVWTWGGAR
jgi:putative flippase GtrA